MDENELPEWAVVEVPGRTSWAPRETSAYRQNVKSSSTRLPAGFCFVVDDASGMVCEPVLLFLFDTYAHLAGSTFAYNTVRSGAFDLKDWMQYCVEFGFPWHYATSADVDAYCSAMLAAVSPVTGRPFATSTITRRRTTVYGFYTWAKERIDAPEDTPSNSLLRASAIGEGRERIDKRPEEKQHVSVMERPQARRILETLGPLPQPRDESAICETSSRDRMGGEIAISTGLRISEITNLTVDKFRHLMGEEIVELRGYPIPIFGKGKKNRQVFFSGVLVNQILTYISGERAQIVAAFGEVNTRGRLLLNPKNAGKASGKTVGIRTLERAVQGACFKNNFYRLEEAVTILERAGGEIEIKSRIIKVADFVFHDFRHTFSVWTYYARKMAGDPEPWLYLQTVLGHEELATTMKTYLKVTVAFEAGVSDRYMETMNG